MQTLATNKQTNKESNQQLSNTGEQQQQQLSCGERKSPRRKKERGKPRRVAVAVRFGFFFLGGGRAGDEPGDTVVNPKNLKGRAKQSKRGEQGSKQGRVVWEWAVQCSASVGSWQWGRQNGPAGWTGERRRR